MLITDMKGIKMNIKEKIRGMKIQDILCIAAFALLIYNFLMLVYINLFQLQNHLGYDTSSYILKAHVMWQQGTFLPEYWSEQTTLYLDSAVPLAALLNNVFHNIIVAYGMANLIIDIGMIAVLIFILKDLGINRLNTLIVLNMFLCPYFCMYFNNANDVDWYSSILIAGCWYGVKTLIMLLIFKTILSIEKQRKPYILAVITILLSLLTGISSGYYVLVTIFLPAFLYYGIKLLKENDFKVLKTKALLYLSINAFVIILGKKIAVDVIGFTSKDSNMLLVGLKDFWKNLGSIFLGFIQLLGGMHADSNVGALSLDGINYLSGFVIAILCIIAIVYYIVKEAKRKENEVGFLLAFMILFTNIAMFAVLYTTYGQPIFETRYLCILYIMIMLLLAYYLREIKWELIWKRMIVVGLLGVLGIKSVMGFSYFNNTKINLNNMEQIIEYVNMVDTPVVYVLGDDIAIDGRNLRVLDSEHVYKIISDNLGVQHWGDYTYYDENSWWQGATVLVASAEKFELLPDYQRNIYVQYASVDNFNIYRSEENKFDFSSTLLFDKTTKNIDYMYSPSIHTANGDFDNSDGTFITNGTSGFVQWGPYAHLKAGTYNFILNYEVLESVGDSIGTFDISIDNGTFVADSANISAKDDCVILSNVTFDHNVSALEYRCFVENGARIKLKSVEIEVLKDEKN